MKSEKKSEEVLSPKRQGLSRAVRELVSLVRVAAAQKPSSFLAASVPCADNGDSVRWKERKELDDWREACMRYNHPTVAGLDSVASPGIRI